LIIKYVETRRAGIEFIGGTPGDAEGVRLRR
jgi:hypothetical protein